MCLLAVVRHAAETSLAPAAATTPRTRSFDVGRKDQRIYHYHWGRNHQSLANRLIFRNRATAANDGSIYRRRRLGAMLNLYYRGSA
jgi:hypothetical protein